MKKQEIVAELVRVYGQFSLFISKMNEAQFTQAAEGKWSAGQQLDHLCRSVQPLILPFRLPKFALRLMFGKPNRPLRSYDEVVNRYKENLAAGGKASKQFIPPIIAFAQQKELCKQLTSTVGKLAKLVGRCSEESLDAYLLPHPLLGKMSLREMLYFTIYHVQHHQESIKSLLQK